MEILFHAKAQSHKDHIIFFLCDLRLCVKYFSLVHFNLNQNIQQNFVSPESV